MLLSPILVTDCIVEENALFQDDPQYEKGLFGSIIAVMVSARVGKSRSGGPAVDLSLSSASSMGLKLCCGVAFACSTNEIPSIETLFSTGTSDPWPERLLCNMIQVQNRSKFQVSARSTFASLPKRIEYES